MLPGLEQNVNAVTSGELRRAMAPTPRCARIGSVWRVEERGWPADVGKVRKLVLDLGALNIVEEKTRLPANYPQLGVEDVSSPKATGTRVESPRLRTWAIIIGKSSGAKSGYVRVATAAQTLLAAPQLRWTPIPRLARHTLLDVSVARIRQVEEHPAQGAAFTAHATRRSRRLCGESVAEGTRAQRAPGPPTAGGTHSAH